MRMASDLVSIPFLKTWGLVSGQNLEDKIRSMPSNFKSPRIFVDFLQKAQLALFAGNVDLLNTNRISDVHVKDLSHIEETNRLVFTNNIDLEMGSGVQIEDQSFVFESFQVGGKPKLEVKFCF